MQAPEAPARNAPNGDVATDDPRPSNAVATLEGNIYDIGWCQIIEESPDV